MWIRKDFPPIEGYETLGDDVSAKRFIDFRIDQLLDAAYPVGLFRDGFQTREEFCNLVIIDFDYPFRWGLPTDKHRNNWFDGNCCHQLTQDYWQTASETLITSILNQRANKKGYGDCEDVSILLTTLFLEKGWPAYQCFGLVLQNGVVLGGHGWSIFQDENGIWRLYEATLDIPPEYPSGYPQIDPEETSWEINGLTYQGLARFNRDEYYESGEGNMMSSRLRLNIARQETRKKYKAISEAWRRPVKPLRKAGIMSKIRRWR
jgi:hypothetical protein